ncbi:hypothetical protein SAMD00079811_80520 (plasmid) [Scytonema sp. HK-05]|nr:hypothetical protein SAMD00079811_80520 [Scytonema sp. HK-05]
MVELTLHFRCLTSPDIVIIICSYFDGFNLNLSEATLNIFNKRIKCSTNIRSDAISLFFSFWNLLNSPFFDFFVGVLIDGSPI